MISFSDLVRPSGDEPRPAEGRGEAANGAGGRLRGLVLQAVSGQVLKDVQEGQDRREGEEGNVLEVLEIIGSRHLRESYFGTTVAKLRTKYIHTVLI